MRGLRFTINLPANRGHYHYLNKVFMNDNLHPRQPNEVGTSKLAIILILTAIICGLATFIFTAMAYNYVTYIKHGNLAMTVNTDHITGFTFLDERADYYE